MKKSPRSNTSGFSLSANQKSLWFLYRAAPESAAYHLGYLFRIHGEFSLSAFKKAFERIVRRHSSLRTTFHEEQGLPYQVVHETYDLNIAHINRISDLRKHFKREIRRLYHKPFLLEDKPPYRIAVFERQEGVYLFACFHHIIMDLWSFSVLLKELGTFYNAVVNCTAEPELPIPPGYDRFVARQAACRGMENDWQFWQKRFKTVPSDLDLPVDLTRSAQRTYFGRRAGFTIKEDLAQKLKQCAAGQNATLYMLMLAVYGILLNRYSRQNDFIIGTAASGRTRSVFKDTLGFFANSLPLRIILKESSSFNEFLAGLRATVFSALRHQAFPFQTLVERLAPDRNMDLSPLFRVFFMYFSANRFRHIAPLAMGTRANLQLGHLNLELVSLETLYTQFDLSLLAIEQENQIKAAFEYSVDLFSGSTIRTFIRHYIKLLQEVARDPCQRIQDIVMLTAEENKNILTWSRTERPRVPFRSVVSYFKDIGRTHGAHICIEDQEESLSCEQVDHRSDCIATAIVQRLGPSRGRAVVVILERSSWVAVCMMGVFKCGAVYVPVDPDTPDQRIRNLISDCKAELVFTETCLYERISRLMTGVQVINVHSLDDSFNKILIYDAKPGDPAFIIYTSGSTVQPKGVIQTHRCLSNLVRWQIRTTGSGWRIMQYAPLCFDVSVQEMLYALLSAGTLVLIDKKSRYRFDLLGQWMGDHDIQFFIMPFSALSLLFRYSPHIADIDSLRFIVTSGERFEMIPHLSDYVQRHPHVEIHNQYGPTETHVATCEIIRSGEGRVLRYPPIGRPVDCTDIFIIDGNGRLAPVGVPGEIVIGGYGLANGYLNQPDLTRRRFKRHPLLGNERVYHTGDVGRWRADGRIEFLGRQDDQIKLSGYRIEPSEIESAMCRMSGVVQAAVVLRRVKNRDVLVGFYRAKHDIAPDVFYGQLRAELPAFMLPAHFCRLEKFPRTASGKTDRSALKLFQDVKVGPPPCENTPRDDIEAECAEMVARLVDHENPDIHENFFFLGGNSLKAIQLIARIKERFHIDLSISTVFRYPTVAQLAQQIRSGSNRHDVTIPKAGKARVPAHPSQKRIYFLEHLAGKQPVYSIPAAFMLSGPFSVSLFKKSLAIVCQKYPIYRTVFIQSNRTLYQHVLEMDTNEWLTLIFSTQDYHDRPDSLNLALADATSKACKTFDLNNGPLLKCVCYQLEPHGDTERTLCFFNCHHIITDAWSLDLLASELCECYGRLSLGMEYNATAPELTFKDYTMWYHDHMTFRDNNNPHRTYWVDRVGGVDTVLNLPREMQRSDVPVFAGDMIHTTMPVSLWQKIKTYPEKAGNSLFCFLLAGVKLLLSVYCHQENIVVGVPVAGRDMSESEKMHGLFVNTIVSADKIDPGEAVHVFLSRVESRFREDLQHADVPLEQVAADARLRHHPHQPSIFDVMVSFVDDPFKRLDFPGVCVRPVYIHNRSSKTDISFLFVSGKELTLLVEFNTVLFQRLKIERMIKHFFNLLESIVNHSHRPVKDLNVLSADERCRLVHDLNPSPPAAAASEKLFIPAFLSAVKKHAFRPALCAGEKIYTYAELECLSARLAAVLTGRYRTKPEDPVAVLVRRSEWTLVAPLAILRAGGVYLPLDPDDPATRIESILNESRVRLVLTTSDAGLVIKADIDTFYLDHGLKEQGAHSAPLPDIKAGQAAYIIYTSGSTGQPKGSVIEHGNLGAMIHSFMRLMKIVSNDRFLNFFRSSFDASLLELLLPLIAGASVYIPQPDLILKSAELAAEMRKNEVTICFFTPSYLQTVGLEKFSFLRIMGSGGEPAVSIPDDVNIGGTEYWNFYGPTETTVLATAFRIDNAKVDQPVPIGTPLDFAECYIMRHGSALQPEGVAGEIVIGGKGVGRGYLGLPEITDKFFIPHPFKKGEKVYRTGDLGRRRPDGTLEFLGRMDQQIKIHGFRLEPEEIHRFLHKQFGISRSIARVVEHHGIKELVVYVQACNNGYTERRLKEEMKKHLPVHMVPSRIILLSAFPMTLNGKIDVKALPAPESVKKPDKYLAAPATLIEKEIAGVFENVLNNHSISRTDNFFQLGANSLSLIAVHGKLSERYSSLTITDFFQYPTIEKLARYLSNQISPKKGGRYPRTRARSQPDRRKRLAARSGHLKKD